MYRNIKKSWIIPALLLFVSTGCNLFPDKDPIMTEGFNLKIGDAIVLTKNEIQYYDYSTHLIYLKSGVKLNAKELANQSFSIVCNKETIYEGIAFAKMDSLNENEVVLGFEGVNNQTLCLNKLNYFIEIYSDINDPRSDPRIEKALKVDLLYHAGLNCSIDTIIRHSAIKIELILDLKNNDSFNYFYFDPEKMTTAELYSISAGGLSLYETDFNFCSSIYINATPPENLACCGISDYVSLIKSGESKKLKISYDNYPSIVTGEYIAVYPFSGAFYMNINEASLENGRMWHGYYHIVRKVSIK
ncbi:MAG: hypothetical protein ACERKD_00850 [Prolixibacteraceae bacterium]